LCCGWHPFLPGETFGALVLSLALIAVRRRRRRLRALVVALVPRAACPIRAIDELDGSRAGVWVPSRVAALNCHEKL
jgi:hypothetical protein